MAPSADIHETTPLDLRVLITPDRRRLTLESQTSAYRLTLDSEMARALAGELTKHALVLDTADDVVLGVSADGARHDRAGPIE